jgi:hypothetical protein
MVVIGGNADVGLLAGMFPVWCMKTGRGIGGAVGMMALSRKRDGCEFRSKKELLSPAVVPVVVGKVEI